MGFKKVVSYKFCLNDNDWNEIRKALPKLASRKAIIGYNLSETMEEDQDFLDLLENHFNLSFAKDAKEYLENNEEDFLEDIPGFGEAVGAIDDEVENYIDSNNVKLKASDFEDEEEFDDWLENFTGDEIASELWDIIRNNPDNPLLDNFVSELNKRR